MILPVTLTRYNPLREPLQNGSSGSGGGFPACEPRRLAYPRFKPGPANTPGDCVAGPKESVNPQPFPPFLGNDLLEQPLYAVEFFRPLHRTRVIGFVRPIPSLAIREQEGDIHSTRGMIGHRLQIRARMAFRGVRLTEPPDHGAPPSLSPGCRPPPQQLPHPGLIVARCGRQLPGPRKVPAISPRHTPRQSRAAVCPASL